MTQGKKGTANPGREAKKFLLNPESNNLIPYMKNGAAFLSQLREEQKRTPHRIGLFNIQQAMSSNG